MTPTNLKFLSWNVNGIRAIYRKGQFENLFKQNFDFICLQETKISEPSLTKELKHVSQYTSWFSHASKAGYSGVAVYVKNSFLEKYKSFSVSEGFGDSDIVTKGEFDSEGRTLRVDFDDTTLFNIYFPNGQMSEQRLAYKMSFYNAFSLLCQKLIDDGRKIIVCGDVNTNHFEIDLARPKENEFTSGFLKIERDWISSFLELGFLDTFRCFNSEGGNYTWWDMRTAARERNIGWRIDYFFVTQNLKNNLVSAAIHPEVIGSDHCPISLELKL
jgi:exodeoxyribonuclease III